MVGKRAARNDPKPYQRERSATYTSKNIAGHGYPHGRWTETEALVLLIMYKYAIRMQSSTEDVIGMYTQFSIFNAHQTPKWPIRQKTSGQITKKLIHLNCVDCTDADEQDHDSESKRYVEESA